MSGPGSLTILATAMLFASAVPDSLRPETLRAFDRYVQLTEARIQSEVEGKSPLLWIDRQSAAVRAALMKSLHQGEVVSARLETKDGKKSIEAGGALIHHWIGTVLLPRTTLSRVRATVQSYDRYAEWFAPLIRRAQITSREGNRFNVAMRTEMQKILTVTVDADYAIDYQSIGTNALHVRSLARNIHIVDAAGTSSERRTPADQTFGFLWRLNTYCTFRDEPAGVVEQCESVSLTRDVPFGLGMIIRPLISGIPRETLEFTLGRVRQLTGN